MAAKTDMEGLLRDGMERFTEDVRAPAGLAAAAGRRHRRRVTVRISAACGGVAAVAAAAALVVTLPAGGAPASTGTAGTQARTVAYVVSRVKQALASEHLVYYGRTASADGPSATWAYGSRSRFEEFTGEACGHTLANGECTHRGGSEPFLAVGTALVKGRLTGAYVTYFDHRYSLSRIVPGPVSACSTTARLSMSGPVIPSDHWSAFIAGTLGCGTAKVTGHVWVNGVLATRITGKPVTVRLSPGYAKAVREKWARVRWTLYVDPTTYLPVRIFGSTATFGGPAASTLDSGVTNVRWLKPTTANIAKATVAIPPGYHRVGSPADQ
jgi:hypothetical protein